MLVQRSTFHTKLDDQTFHAFVAGRRQSLGGSTSTPKENPSTKTPLPSVFETSSDGIDQSVQSAKDAFSSWAKVSLSERKALLLAIADKIDQNGDRLSELDSLEMGKPIAVAKSETGIASGFFRFYAEAIDKVEGRVLPGSTGVLEILQRRPRGVIVAITPWNYPLINIALKAAPILAAGNVLIAKPSEYASGSTLLLAELASEAGVPSGVFNALSGARKTGEILVRHQDVSMIGFTGSTFAGRAIMKAAGEQSLKPIQLECGSKSPQIVFADAIEGDIDRLADALLGAAMANQGQLCVAKSRLLVEATKADTLIERLQAACSKIVPTASADPSGQFGPLANKAGYEKTISHLDQASADGGEMVVDGRFTRLPENGYFIGPSIVSNTKPESHLFHQEVFGPILSITTFETAEGAVQLANDSDYGLSASVWTRDLVRGHQVADAINASHVTLQAAPCEVEGAGFAHSKEPFGQSGFGAEGGLDSLKTFSWSKSIEVKYA